jgi:tetratricopeptide (TPR) repeat protein
MSKSNKDPEAARLHSSAGPAVSSSSYRELLKGLTHHKAGKHHLAEKAYRRVLDGSPRNADALNLLGALLFERGETAQAISHIRKAVALQPRYSSAHCNLGNALLAAGRDTEAIQSYRLAVSLNPAFAAGHSNLGRALCKRGEYAAAIESGRKAAALAPAVPEVWELLAISLRSAGRPEEALPALRSAAALAPQRGGLHRALAGLLLELRRYKEACEEFSHAIEIDGRDLESLRGLAIAFRLSGDMEASLGTIRKAIAVDRNRGDLWNDMGAVLRSLGRFDEASDAFRKAITINPTLGDAYRNLAACGQMAADETSVSRLQSILGSQSSSAEDRASAGFTLGKILDENGRYKEAFAAYSEANRLTRETLRVSGHEFNAAQFGNYVTSRIRRYTTDFFNSVKEKGNSSELPVFVVGMPRSGTTLVEQIIASHPLAFGAGEIMEIGLIAGRMENLPELPREHILNEAAHHLSFLQSLSNGAERVIDKMPDNIFHLGTIAALFPKARIIFCQRDSNDTALSCFFQKFSGDHLAFSYDLEDCIIRCRQTERLSTHWREVLPLTWMNVQYEALVRDQEAETRRLISFLGLDWSPKCLEFHLTDRPVRTASNWQVRQRLYDRSIGRWRHYGDALKNRNSI